MVALLLVGLALVHVLHQGKTNVSKDQALTIARTRIDFEPNGHQIRYIRRGIPSHGFWVASFYIRKANGGYSRVTIVLVDAESGKVTEVRRTT
jgi:hypothetical protein